jgi:hypothetical protein
LKFLIASGAEREPGSGKLETPWARMHLAYSTSAPPGAVPPEPVLPEPVLPEPGLPEPRLSVAVALAGTVVVVVARLATLVLGEPPPQAAVARARPMAAEVTSQTRRRPGPQMTWAARAQGQRPLVVSRSCCASGGTMKRR